MKVAAVLLTKNTFGSYPSPLSLSHLITKLFIYKQFNKNYVLNGYNIKSFKKVKLCTFYWAARHQMTTQRT